MALIVGSTDAPVEEPRPYPVLLERSLVASGVPARCTVRARSRLLLADCLRDFEDQVLQHSPDVVILNFGHYEAFSGAVPQLLRRYAYEEFPRQGVAALAVRRLLGPALRRAARAVQVVHGRALGASAGRRSAARFARDLALLLHGIEALACDPTVVLVSLTHAGTRFERQMPGINERIDRLNEVLRTAAADHGRARVRYFDATEALAGVRWRSDDDVHLSADGHAVLAHRLHDLLSELPSAAHGS